MTQSYNSNMSFSSNVKKELSEINNLAKKSEVKYEFLGYLSSANINYTSKEIKYLTESEYNINRFSKLLKNVEISNFNIDIQGKIYNITLKKEELKKVKLENIDKDFFTMIFKDNFKEIDNKILFEKENLSKAFFRGLFLGSGSINDPKLQYHLEIELPNDIAIDTLIEVLYKYGIKVKKLENHLYIKDGEEISKFIAFIGASKSVLDFEDIRVQKDMSNKINRLVNCKTANLNKTLNASVEQINAIKLLKESGKYNKMDENLIELAELRLEFPDLPLSELRKKIKKSNRKVWS